MSPVLDMSPVNFELGLCPRLILVWDLVPGKEKLVFGKFLSLGVKFQVGFKILMKEENGEIKNWHYFNVFLLQFGIQLVF